MSNDLEDTFADILNKAARGLRLDAAALAGSTGIPAPRVVDALAGKFDEGTVLALAIRLGLSPDRLAALARGEYRPGPTPSIPGLAMFTTPFDDITVNSYLVWDAGSRRAAAFDTGSDCSGVLETIASQRLELESVFLTHTHGDHIFDLDRLLEATGAEAWTSAGEPLAGARSFTPGQPFHIGGLSVATLPTWGHSPAGVTYLVRGLPRTIAIVGDSIFAGSMGGGNVSYADAIRNNREQILTLDEDTILCPGHGPLTTVGEEKRHNPFFEE